MEKKVERKDIKGHRLYLCKHARCDIGCFSLADKKKHEKQTGHMMDEGRMVEPHRPPE